jgi:Rhodopirellula transposase DDE domain
MASLSSAEAIQELKNKYQAMAPFLNERSRRIWAATEAKAIGKGGRTLLFKVTGLDYKTIAKGWKEIESSSEQRLDIDRIRKSGGGSKKASEKDASLLADIKKLVEATTLGDPESPLKWTSKSTRHIADELNKKNHRSSHSLVARELLKIGYSLQGNKKTKEGGDHPDRNDQFQFINDKTKTFQQQDKPVISVDTKKKENIGNFKNNGREYHQKQTAPEVNVYDFIDKEKGKVSPYGVYDLSKNKGWVSVGISADTARFAVNSIRSWWYKMGQQIYPDASEIYINADGGGSNGYRTRLWKTELQQLANELKMVINVSHFPPGTSKWNKIEHRMFSFISKNWRGRPLIDRATVVNLIGNTTTKTGLVIKAELDENIYEKGIKISDKELAQVNLHKEKFHGEWNYKIIPNY